MKSLLLILTLFITNCGYEYESVEEQEAAEKKETANEGETESDQSDTESFGSSCEGGDRVEQNSYGLTGEECEGYVSSEDTTAGGWYFSGRRLDWDSATLATPPGFRLPTRSELTYGYDSGVLNDLFLEYAWSSTDGDNDSAYIFHLANGQSALQHKSLKFLVIYLSKE